MGKWFGNVMTTLVLLALTSFVGGLLKGPIDELFSGDRLTARLQLAPWFPQPEIAPSPAPSPSAALAIRSNKTKTKLDEKLRKSREEMDKAMQEMRASLDQAQNTYAISSSDNLGFARMIITNNSSKPIKDISFRILPPYAPQKAVVIDENGNKQVLVATGRIKVPDMRPGDQVGVFLWSIGFYRNTLLDRLKTYSSVGKFRIYIDSSNDEVAEYGSDTGRFLDTWAWPVFGSTLVGITLVLGIGLAVQDGYYKTLLRREKFYYRERERFESDEKSFKPAFSEAAKIAQSKSNA